MSSNIPDLEPPLARSGRKRALVELKRNDDEPARQRQRVSGLFFSHPQDIAQFESIYIGLVQVLTTKQCGLSHDLVKEIAEFATGKIEPCDNKKCSNDISVLYDPTLGDFYQTFTPEDENDQNWESQIFCGDCAPKAMQCQMKRYQSDNISHAYWEDSPVTELFCSRRYVQSFCKCGAPILECSDHAKHEGLCPNCSTEICCDFCGISHYLADSKCGEFECSICFETSDNRFFCRDCEQKKEYGECESCPRDGGKANTEIGILVLQKEECEWPSDIG